MERITSHSEIRMKLWVKYQAFFLISKQMVHIVTNALKEDKHKVQTLLFVLCCCYGRTNYNVETNKVWTEMDKKTHNEPNEELWTSLHSLFELKLQQKLWCEVQTLYLVGTCTEHTDRAHMMGLQTRISILKGPPSITDDNRQEGTYDYIVTMEEWTKKQYIMYLRRQSSCKCSTGADTLFIRCPKQA